jgi:glyoxylase-like metal-dependent hydrolase (beta-lactamase superfamily II)
MPGVQITSGIRRLGPGLANAYLLEEAGEITIVDTGAPAYWNALPGELAAMGRTLDDVRAVVLTHAHTDHIGFAERIRRERGVPVSVHELDVPLTQRPSYPKWNGSLNIVAALRFLAFALGHGMARVPPILEVSIFGDGATLDVPGSLRVIHVPGHSEGMVALLCPSRDAIFVGDAFVTLDVISGASGPRISPFNVDARRAYESLSRLERVDASLVLPGHGEAWTGGLSEAVRIVRSATPPQIGRRPGAPRISRR